MIRELLIALHGERDRPVVALTFDDGPNPHATPRVLDILAEADCPATFFVIGQWAVEFPELVKRMAREGHGVGGHTFSHRFRQTGREDAFFDFVKGNEAIEGITGKKVRFVRVPGFEYRRLNADGSLRIRELVTGKLGKAIRQGKITVVDRDVNSADWRGLEAEEILRLVVPQARNGAVALFHDGSEKRADWRRRPAGMVKALPRIIRAWRDKGFEFVTLAEMRLMFASLKIESHANGLPG
jgi:peptidoglycan/xylan/chitin deacetylase (PgdA/CDA1 family)